MDKAIAIFWMKLSIGFYEQCINYKIHKTIGTDQHQVKFTIVMYMGPGHPW